MRIGLINIEPKIVNTAYMLISQYHKDRGDSVGWWHPLTAKEFDHVYCSSLFDFTDKSEVPEYAITGGTGFDVNSKLSQVIEAGEYDYSLYPKCETSYVWFGRGCDRDCPFCVVRQKEGRFHLVSRKLLNPKGKYITVMDNDFFANPNWQDVINWIGRVPIDMQGFDVRKMTEEKCKALGGLKQYKRKRFKTAWDNFADKKKIIPKLKMLAGIVRPGRITCYVLIGWDSTRSEDMYRVMKLKEMGYSPFVMQFKKGDLYQDMFARWVNIKSIFQTKTFEQYQLRKLGRVVFK